MWSTRLLVTACAVCLAATSVVAQRQLQLVATITDPSGAAIATLDPAEVRVLENGAPLTVVSVTPITRVSKVQILVDNGTGMPAAALGDLRNALRGLLEALPPDLEITIVTTSPQPRFLERATTDRQKLLQSLDRLTPDSGAGRFVESLHEATDRVSKDKTPDASYTILTLGTTSGDASGVRDSDVKEIFERVQRHRTLVHAVILNYRSGGGGGGTIQLDLGQNVAQATGGRFEQPALPNALPALLQDIGKQIATSLGGGSQQFRITAQRAGGGDLGALGLGVTGKLVSGVTVIGN